MDDFTFTVFADLIESEASASARAAPNIGDIDAESTFPVDQDSPDYRTPTWCVVA